VRRTGDGAGERRGHDAQILAARCNVGLLFVPSVAAITLPEEHTDPGHLELGARVLVRALELLAY